MNVARVTLVIVALCLLGLLAVSFDATRRIGAMFHQTRGLEFAFAASVEVGIAGCAFGRAWRARHEEDAGGFARILNAMLVMSFVANALAGARLPAWLRWPLIVAFGAVVPVLTLAFADLLAMLGGEQVRAPNAQSMRNQCAINAQSPLRARIVELYGEHPELPVVEAARLLECHPATVRRIRAQVCAKAQP